MKVGKRKNIIQRGFTVIELCLVIVLVAPILFLATGLLNLSTKSMLGTEQQTKVIRQDTDFASKLNKTIRESATSFTVPKNSFVEEKLTAGWDYMGLMNNVKIPAAVSRTGHEIPSEQALVYIEYAGESSPTTISADANLLHTADGYFVQHVLAHSYTDVNGIRHEYSLEFLPTDSTQTAAQNITYDFSVKLVDAQGNYTEEKTDLDISTMLNTLNAVQVVYKGSKSNPATALAFRKDFLPIYSAHQSGSAPVTVAMVLDVSGSMRDPFGTTTRIEALKKAASNIITKLSTNDRITINIVPFSEYGGYGDYGSEFTAIIGNANRDKDALLSCIQGIEGFGGTNLGDGVRVSYHMVREFINNQPSKQDVILIILTDGAMNMWSIEAIADGGEFNFYKDAGVPRYIYKSLGYRRNTIVFEDTAAQYPEDIMVTFKTSKNYSDSDVYELGARAYMKLFAKKFTDDLNAKAFLIDISGGMSPYDLEAFREVLDVEAKFDVDNEAQFEETFDQIFDNINELSWAFEGPRL